MSGPPRQLWLRTPHEPLGLARRFTVATAIRLTLLTVLLAGIVFVDRRGGISMTSFSAQLAAATLAVAFALSAVYGWFLRTRTHLERLVRVQIVLDQLIWTVVVYLSGAATSGATSLYGVTCILGAMLSGMRGSALAAAAAALSYLCLVGSMLMGWLPGPPDQPASAYALSAGEALVSGLVTLLALSVVALLAGNLSERLRAAGGQVLLAQARADRAEREASLGRLAAGLAHEIRNPLGAISGSVRMLRGNSALDPEDRRLCEIIEREAQRLDDLVSDMLNLAKPRRAQKQQVDLAALANEVVAFSRHSGRSAEDVALVCEAPPAVHILADAAMVRQMLWNLVRNAVQASAAGEQVRVEVGAGPAGVTVSVIDSGVGLDAEAKEHLFDAFFTTRSKGTGIGLAVVKRIVDEHGWDIAVLDTPGGGATFTVYVGEPVESATGMAAVPSQQRWTLFPKPS